MSASCKLVSVCLIALLPFAGGCGGGIQYELVEGTVTTQDGKPLDKILVEFWPETEGSRSFGETDSQGRFKLMTDDGKTAGASVGNHRIILKDSAVHGDKFMGRAAENVDLSNGRKPRISDKYGNPETTKLVQRVEAGKKNEFNLQTTK